MHRSPFGTDSRNPTPQRILLIEADTALRTGLLHTLELAGFAVTVATNSTEGAPVWAEGSHDLVLLDLDLPNVDTLALLRSMRTQGDESAVIVLSDRDAAGIEALQHGADDFVRKPFSLAELKARMRAVLRRTDGQAHERQDNFRFGDLEVDFLRFTVQNGDARHQLSRYEADILRMLIDRRGEVVTRSDLLKEVWGYVHLPTTRTVDCHIARLRRKVEVDGDSPEYIATVRGLGYRFDPRSLSRA